MEKPKLLREKPETIKMVSLSKLSLCVKSVSGQTGFYLKPKTDVDWRIGTIDNQSKTYT